MKVLLTVILLLSTQVYASAEEDSAALSNSFNTVPLGRTTHGFVTKKSDAEATEFQEQENIRNFTCSQDRSKCVQPAVHQTSPRKMKKKDSTDSMMDSLLE